MGWVGRFLSSRPLKSSDRTINQPHIPQEILDRIAKLPQSSAEESDWEEAPEIIRECPQAWDELPEGYKNRGLGAVDVGGGFWSE